MQKERWIFGFCCRDWLAYDARGQLADRAMQGCNPSAALEAGAGRVRITRPSRFSHVATITEERFTMTVRLDLTPEVQAGLMSQAQASGLSLEAFAEQVLREKSHAGWEAEATPLHTAYELSSDERLREFHAWLNSHAGNTVVLPDEAMEHESIYGDHGR